MPLPNVNRADALPAGSRLNNTYIVQRVLGSGAFGITYLAEHVHLGSQHVIKEYFPDSGLRTQGTSVVAKSTSDQELFDWGLNSFFREAKLLYGLNHANIVKVSDLFEANGTAYFVMPYIRGITLHQWIKEHQTPSESELTQIFLPLLDGLKYIHGRQLLHRDIKPENILITEDQIPVLIDFGAARNAIGQKSRPLTQILTPPFAPIEQYHSRDVFLPALDLYSLGACIYQAVTHQLVEEAPARIAETDTQPKLAGSSYERQYSRAFLSAVDRALNVKAENRFQNAGDMQQALLGHLPQQHSAPAYPAADATYTTQIVHPHAGSADVYAHDRQPAPTSYSRNTPPPRPQDYGYGNDFRQNPPPAQSGKKRKIFAIAAVLAICLAAVAAWFALSGGKADEGNPKAKEKETVTKPADNDPPIVVADNKKDSASEENGAETEESSTNSEENGEERTESNSREENDGRGERESGGTAGRSSERLSQSDLEELNRDLPRMMSENIRMDKVYLYDENTLALRLTHTAISSDQFTDEQKTQFSKAASEWLAEPACEDRIIRRWLRGGGLFIAPLYDTEDKPIAVAVVDGGECR